MPSLPSLGRKRSELRVAVDVPLDLKPGPWSVVAEQAVEFFKPSPDPTGVDARRRTEGCGIEIRELGSESA
jgi:hypothetical protein